MKNVVLVMLVTKKQPSDDLLRLSELKMLDYNFLIIPFFYFIFYSLHMFTFTYVYLINYILFYTFY